MHVDSFLFKLFTLRNYRLQVSSDLSSYQHCSWKIPIRPLPASPILFTHIWFLFLLTLLLYFLLLFVLSEILSLSFHHVLSSCLHISLFSHFFPTAYLCLQSHILSLPLFSPFTLSPRNRLMSIKVEIMRGNISAACTHAGPILLCPVFPWISLEWDGIWLSRVKNYHAGFEGNESGNLKMSCW